MLAGDAALADPVLAGEVGLLVLEVLAVRDVVVIIVLGPQGQEIFDVVITNGQPVRSASALAALPNSPHPLKLTSRIDALELVLIIRHLELLDLIEADPPRPPSAGGDVAVLDPFHLVTVIPRRSRPSPSPREQLATGRGRQEGSLPLAEGEVGEGAAGGGGPERDDAAGVVGWARGRPLVPVGESGPGLGQGSRRRRECPQAFLIVKMMHMLE
ncbi:hypothetical protein B0T16DRAFT_406911 [Cercophora newfieldiana]|uniref:Uncharacterized protein n=1 Tax=Cercophora newfieldiana TaxID=92897 RepID=A0AA39YJ02_9PEZI|nr:hypothetical protein B0T16DRAFT_406911 [Cercophora newfieldiana]